MFEAAHHKKATQGCPCGSLGDDRVVCRCSQLAIDRYRARISGPLLDRIDLIVEVPRVPVAQLSGPPGEASAAVRARVAAARARQAERAQGRFVANGRLTSGQVRAVAALQPGVEKQLHIAVQAAALSARAHDKVLAVARTIADLEGRENIGEDDVAEAIGYRMQGLGAERMAA